VQIAQIAYEGKDIPLEFQQRVFGVLSYCVWPGLLPKVSSKGIPSGPSGRPDRNLVVAGRPKGVPSAKELTPQYSDAPPGGEVI